ncbi:short-chain dehydrogenase/ reductase [Corynespora cassiicola Philippines]|uniref:Short-chain dehydrogenase/ reductase n=1 Tax=Corynespora cassiicola Philippines TaxID=1448308 RepID=A0A2T2NPF4_CORCC|nr:short-chain dehydrogenase/ reductase [Corynespora cassiicola Philippines]
MSNPDFGFSTTSEDVATLYSSSIKDKIILITGVSPNGLGLYTAKVLASHSPALLILAARSASTLKAAESEIKAASPTCPIRLLELDIGSISTVRSAASKVLSWTDVPKVDILINNAGIMACPFEKSADGIERQLATNHVGPWLFTNLLVPRLRAAGSARVVFLSSEGHLYGPVRFDDHNFDDGKAYDADVAYGQSKTANILTAVALGERLKGKGVQAFSVHPGLVFTNLSRFMTPEYLKAKGFMDEEGNLTISIPPKTHAQGTATTMVAALDPSTVERAGAYLADCQVVEVGERLAAYAQDKENAEKLWVLTEKLVGERFEY